MSDRTTGDVASTAGRSTHTAHEQTGAGQGGGDEGGDRRKPSDEDSSRGRKRRASDESDDPSSSNGSSRKRPHAFKNPGSRPEGYRTPSAPPPSSGSSSNGAGGNSRGPKGESPSLSPVGEYDRRHDNHELRRSGQWLIPGYNDDIILDLNDDLLNPARSGLLDIYPVFSSSSELKPSESPPAASPPPLRYIRTIAPPPDVPPASDLLLVRHGSLRIPPGCVEASRPEGERQGISPIDRDDAQENSASEELGGGDDTSIENAGEDDPNENDLKADNQDEADEHRDNGNGGDDNGGDGNGEDGNGDDSDGADTEDTSSGSEDISPPPRRRLPHIILPGINAFSNPARSGLLPSVFDSPSESESGSPPSGVPSHLRGRREVSPSNLPPTNDNHPTLERERRPRPLPSPRPPPVPRAPSEPAQTPRRDSVIIPDIDFYEPFTPARRGSTQLRPVSFTRRDPPGSRFTPGSPPPRAIRGHEGPLPGGRQIYEDPDPNNVPDQTVRPSETPSPEPGVRNEDESLRVLENRRRSQTGGWK